MRDSARRRRGPTTPDLRHSGEWPAPGGRGGGAELCTWRGWSQPEGGESGARERLRAGAGEARDNNWDASGFARVPRRRGWTLRLS